MSSTPRDDSKPHYEPSHWFTCEPCGKRTYLTRKAAKRVTRTNPEAQGRRCHPYPCPDGVGYHIGHLPINVLHGHLTRDHYVNTLREGK